MLKRKRFVMKTIFFNVQHGDAIFINMGTIGLVRDFGTLSSKSTPFVQNTADHLLKAYSFIKRNNINYSFEAMLTHPHIDHYSGFEYLSNNSKAYKMFDRAYIPWLDFSTLHTLHAIYLKFSVYYLYIISSSNTNAQNMKDWIKMAPIMAYLSKKVLGVYEGINISHWPFIGNIYWPPLPIQKPIGLGNIQTDLYSNYSSIDNKEIFDIIEEINKQLSPEHRQNIENSFISIYEILKNIKLNDEETANDADILLKVNSILNQIPNQAMPFTNYQLKQKLSSYCKQKMLPNLDNHSIVFDVEEKALFFSDLNNRPIRKIATKHLKRKHYDFIKSAHHGTRISTQLVKSGCRADRIVHCCGWSGKSQYYGPNSLYCNILSNKNYSTNIICTDWVQNSPKWVWPTSGYYVLQPSKKRIKL